jgi:macrolide-specific efflux system membrane fusion protein
VKLKIKILLVKIGGITVVILAIIMVGVSSCKSNQKNASSWQTAVVARQDIGSTVLATGIIKPMVGAEVRVGSRVSGVLKNLHANIGDVVKKGHLLAELDPTEYQAKYNQVDAALKNARANMDYARLDLERKQSLLRKNFISQNQVDMAETAWQIAAAQFNQAEANLEYARIQLEYTKIRAPISGVIASVAIQEGETVAASFSAPTFVNIINLNRLEAWAYVDETDISRIKKGQRVTFTVDTYTDTDFEGRVTAIYPKAEIQGNVVNYVTTIVITDNKGKILRPEMTTTISIFLETRQNVVAVPNGAIRREKGRKFVYVLQQNQPVQRWIKTGWKNGSFIEIIDGLDEGERVILDDVAL